MKKSYQVCLADSPKHAEQYLNGWLSPDGERMSTGFFGHWKERAEITIKLVDALQNGTPISAREAFVPVVGTNLMRLPLEDHNITVDYDHYAKLVAIGDNCTAQILDLVLNEIVIGVWA